VAGDKSRKDIIDGVHYLVQVHVVRVCAYQLISVPVHFQAYGVVYISCRRWYVVNSAAVLYIAGGSCLLIDIITVVVYQGLV